MKIVSAAEMREIDRATSEHFGVPSLTLMENAGSAVVRFILSDYPQAQSISVVCGKGNNGGDGFVVARQLSESGRNVRVLLLCGPDELPGDAATMFQRISILPQVVRDAGALSSVDAAPIFAADLIVDAVLGTGFRPPVSTLYATAISRMNDSRAPIIAVDIPSGADTDALHAQTGAIARADAVVTFTAPRPAHVFGELTSGPTVIAQIGYPPEAIVSKLGLQLSTAPDFASFRAAQTRRPTKADACSSSVDRWVLARRPWPDRRASRGAASDVATTRSVRLWLISSELDEPLDETDAQTISLQSLNRADCCTGRAQTLMAIGPESPAIVKPASCAGCGQQYDALWS
jgi:hydroxyethylthiazole kinase-like uncharacterized protein yjeF